VRAALRGTHASRRLAPAPFCIDVDLSPPPQAARLFPRVEGEPPPHAVRITRLITEGTPSRRRPGDRIRLGAIRDSKGWLTTREWIEMYVADMTADRLGIATDAPAGAGREGIR
jgi:hypothetical protein